MLTYRAIASALLAIITWSFTGSIGDTTGITIAFTISATAAYYLHERIWNGAKWGVENKSRV